MKANNSIASTRRFFALAIIVSFTSFISSAQWVQQASGAAENLVGVVMLDSMKALAIGSINGIFLTTDAGATWTNENAAVNASYQWRGVSFSSPLNGTIVGDHRIETTMDGGLTWTLRSVPSTQQCLSVLNLGAGYMYVGADSGWMYSSSDTGKTWTSTKISVWPIRSIFEYQGPTIPGAPIYYALTPHSLCSKPVYPSLEWNEKVLHNFDGLGSEAYSGAFCAGGGAAFVVGVFGDLWSEPGVLRKPMSDTNWSGMPLTSLQAGVFSGVSAPSSSVVYVCGSSGMIYSSRDGGDDWTRMNSTTTHNLRALSFWNEKRGFAVGDSGTILFTSNGGLTDVGDREGRHPENFNLQQNFPNPFNPSTIFQFTIKNSQFVELKIFDILGREIATLVNEYRRAGNYEAQWDATNFPSGIYLYRLKAGSVVESKKMVLLK